MLLFGRTSLSDLRIRTPRKSISCNGREATARFQARKPGRAVATAETGRDIALRCPGAAARRRYPSLKFPHAASAKSMAGSFLLMAPSLAIAVLAAIACTAIVHRAILAALLASRLICRKSNRANHRCDDGKQNFSVLFHTRFNSPTSLKFRERFIHFFRVFGRAASFRVVLGSTIDADKGIALALQRGERRIRRAGAQRPKQLGCVNGRGLIKRRP